MRRFACPKADLTSLTIETFVLQISGTTLQQNHFHIMRRISDRFHFRNNHRKSRQGYLVLIWSGGCVFEKILFSEVFWTESCELIQKLGWKMCEVSELNDGFLESGETTSEFWVKWPLSFWSLYLVPRGNLGTFGAKVVDCRPSSQQHTQLLWREDENGFNWAQKYNKLFNGTNDMHKTFLAVNLLQNRFR